MINDLVTVGGLTVDNVISSDGRVALGQAGGNGAYAAVGALMWRPRVGLVSCAVESYPSETLTRLRNGGVDLDGVSWSDERLTLCNWFIYDAVGGRDEDLVSAPEALAEAGFPTDHLDPPQISAWQKHLRAQRHLDDVSYSEFRTRHPLTPAQIPATWRAVQGVHLAPSQPDVMISMLDFFGRGNAVITADPGWQLAARSLDEISPILARLDAFLPSEVELRALVPHAGLSDALAALASRSTGAIAVKLGPKGALVWDRLSRTAIPVPTVEVSAVDPTGAGDGFSGGFLAGLVETGDPVMAARFGAVSAARVVSAFGADGALPADRAGARAAIARDMVA
ncbi:MAG: carbohydrate kinase family protein [Pseudomonadota bacterium]